MSLETQPLQMHDGAWQPSQSVTHLSLCAGDAGGPQCRGKEGDGLDLPQGPPSHVSPTAYSSGTFSLL